MNLETTLIMWAVPLYFVMILFESLFSYFQVTGNYHKKEAISNIACGVVQQVGDAAFNLLLIPLYLFVFEQLAYFELETSPMVIITLIFLKDFTHYWIHRFGHEFPLLWSIHLVHHQPKFYNYTVGLRVPLFHHVVDIFPLILSALLGFPIELYIPISVLMASYQFITHSSSFNKKETFLSKVFVTPNHHRVHHGKNDIYINKNYGGMFSFWDRLFGTYQAELKQVPIEYGVMKSSEYTLDPIAANFIYWKSFKKIFYDTYISSLNLILIILAGTFFILNAKSLSIIQTFLQSIVLLIFFKVLVKANSRIRL